jgi:predicted alpha/beta superfamily hydrolase
MRTDGVAFQAHQIDEHRLASRVVAQTFTIKVLQPVRRADGSERFPVLYAPDSDYFFGGFEAMARELQLLGETPRFILVGIGYEDSSAVELLRWRDFATPKLREPWRETLQRLAESPLLNCPELLQTVMHTTDAAQFLQFIIEELMPFVGSRYPTRANENAYFGYSLGGFFGLYALCTRPNAFQHYILGSPGTSYKGRNFGIELIEGLLQSKQAVDAKVFLSVGELEEFKAEHEPVELVTSYYRLAKLLKKAAIPGLELTGRVFPGETHATAWTLAFIHGLKSLLGPADSVPFW